jgi:hypothetical protein
MDQEGEIMAKVIGLFVCLALVVAGCASTVISDERIRSSTAGVLGLEPTQIAIEGRRSELTNTYYVAKTATGAEYACVISGSVLSAGLTDAPKCTKK